MKRHRKKNPHSNTPFNFMNVNARSMTKKFEDIIDLLDSQETDAAVITETWLNSKSVQFEGIINHFRERSPFHIIVKNREARTGGGVAVIVRKEKGHASEFICSTSLQSLEVLPVACSVKGFAKKLLIVAVYRPPKERAAPLSSALNDLVHEAKLKYKDPYIIVAGDFNRAEVKLFRRGHKDLLQLVEEPTFYSVRGKPGILDLVFSNLVKDKVNILKPFNPTDQSAASCDHHHVFVAFKPPMALKQSEVKRVVRPITQKGRVNFLQELNQTDWMPVWSAQDVNDKVRILNHVVQGALAKHLPEKLVDVNIKNKPWMNERIKGRIKKRNVVYRRFGNTQQYKEIRNAVKKEIDDLRRSYYSSKVENLKKTKPAGWHAAVKSFSDPTREDSWTFQSIFPRETDTEIGDILGEYFSKISQEYDPLKSEDIPTTFPSPFRFHTPDDVMREIKCMKVPRAVASGDIPPKILREASYALVSPLTNIYNAITSTCVWPQQWKVATMSAIPKTARAESLDQLRNICLTPTFSKLYEGFVVKWLDEEIADSISQKQFGNIKGLSTNHAVAEFLSAAAMILDKPGRVPVIASFDFSKAFNRISHGLVVKNLAKMGASSHSIALVATFLQGRKSIVKVNNTFSKPYDEPGGSPQGSKLGGYCFSVATNFIPQPEEVPEGVDALKYVDDVNSTEDVCASDVNAASGTQSLLLHLEETSRTEGMKLNAGKTKVLVMDEGRTSRLELELETGCGEKVSPSSKIVFLGYHATGRYGHHGHVDALERKARCRLWALRHLMEAGVGKNDVKDIYCSQIRSVLEYLAPVIHSGLTEYESGQLESVQRTALKIIYGFEKSYQSILEESGLQTILARRQQLVDKFVTKSQVHPRLAHWFPKRKEVHVTLRERREVHEVRCSSERTFNSPIAYYRRRANELEKKKNVERGAMA